MGKVNIEVFIKYKLSTCKAWAQKALVVIYNNQTVDEKNEERTKYSNGKGFSGCDSEILSKLAKWYIAKGFLTGRQLGIVQKRIPKYWKQVLEVSDMEKLKASIMKEFRHLAVD